MRKRLDDRDRESCMQHARTPGQVECKDANYNFLVKYLGLFAAIPTAKETEVPGALDHLSM